MVGPELKERVLASARQLGYSVNAQAQAVARGLSSTVALVVGDIADPYFAGIASGAIRAAEKRQFLVTITSLPTVAHSTFGPGESELVNALLAQRPRGVVFAASREVGGEWGALKTIERLALIGPAIPGIRSLVIDNEGAAAALAASLIGLGYVDFAIVAGPVALSVVRDRVNGFLAVAPAAEVRVGEFTRDGGYAAAAALLAEGRRPSCIFAVADVMAIGVIAAVSDAGLRPGVDIAVAGFDGIPLLRDVSPRLTTVRLPLAEIGELGLELALADDPPRHPNPIRGEVVIGESTPGR